MVWYDKTNRKSQHGQHSKPAASILHCPSEFVSFNLSWILGARGWGGLFGIIKQIWHPCGFANMIVYPSWALSPSGYALGWQCSLGVDNHVGKPTGMSYLYNVYLLLRLTPDLVLPVLADLVVVVVVVVVVVCMCVCIPSPPPNTRPGAACLGRPGGGGGSGSGSSMYVCMYTFSSAWHQTWCCLSWQTWWW